MAKFHGPIGYVHTEETAPGSGVFGEVVEEKNYFGDVTRNARRFEKGIGLNDDLVINNQISVIGNDYAYQNFSAMRYVKWMGTSWKITNVEIQSPRLILTLGGVYHAP